jgi:hypothetical protein
MVAQEMGLRPFANQKTEDEKAMLGQLQYAVEQRIDAEQTARKRPLSRSEKMELMRQIVGDRVMEEMPFYRPDRERPAALLPADKQQSAYVLVGQERVVLSQIPKAFREEVTLARRRSGLTTTEAQLAQLWVKNRNTYKVPR